MGRKLHYKPGSFYRTDDRTGFPQRAERTRLDSGPDFSIDNHTDQALGHLVAVGKRSLRRLIFLIFGADCEHIPCSQHRHQIVPSVLVERPAGVSALRHAVLLIREVVAQEQVIWIDAWRRVAMVKNIEAFWYRSAMQLPRCAMREIAIATVEVTFAVAAFVAMAYPYPASRVRLREILCLEFGGIHG